MVIWLIGLSGAGKTTISRELCEQIRSAGRKCVLLDGDVIREVFGNDLGHSMTDRRKNADRICRLGQFLESQDVNVVCAILSIFHESQEWNRKNLKNYFEVFIDVSIDAVKARDVKGIYGRAADGELTEVVGVDIPFPEPKNPNLVLNNNFTDPPEELASQIFAHIQDTLQG